MRRRVRRPRGETLLGRREQRTLETFQARWELLYRTWNGRCRPYKHTNIRRPTIPQGREVLKWAAMKTVSIGLVGLGGYAQTHLLALNTLQAAGACKIAA